MRRRKNETTDNYIARYKLQPVYYKEYREASKEHAVSDTFTYGVAASLKSRGWEGQYWEWKPVDDKIVEIIQSLSNKDFKVTQFVRKSMKFQIRYEDTFNQGQLMARVHECVGDIAEIKFSTKNTFWIRFK